MRTRIVWLLDLQAKIPTPSEKSHLAKSYKVYPKWIPVWWVDMFAYQRVVERPTLLYCRPMTSSWCVSVTHPLSQLFRCPLNRCSTRRHKKKMFYFKKWLEMCVVAVYQWRHIVVIRHETINSCNLLYLKPSHFFSPFLSSAFLNVIKRSTRHKRENAHCWTNHSNNFT